MIITDFSEDDSSDEDEDADDEDADHRIFNLNDDQKNFDEDSSSCDIHHDAILCLQYRTRVVR